MPVVIAPADFERWLGPGESVGDLLRPAEADRLLAEPVSAQVDSVRNDGPDLIAPIAG
jgi:putative SOS response-associated peptidase YedK